MAQTLAEQADEIAEEWLGCDCIWVSYDDEKQIFSAIKGSLDSFAFQLDTSNFRSVKDLSEKLFGSMKAYGVSREWESI